MRDPDLPDFLFKCHACEEPIPDPDKGFGEGISKGGGFSSMKLFCSQECADGTAVEAALLLMDEEGEEDDGPSWAPSPAELQQASNSRAEDLEDQGLIDDLYEKAIEVSGLVQMTKAEFEADIKDPANWTAWKVTDDADEMVSSELIPSKYQGVIRVEHDVASDVCDFSDE